MSPSFFRVSNLASVIALGTFSLFTLALPAAASAPVDAGVARLSVLTQEVDVRRADSGDTFAATLNTPIALGDDISTVDNSFAEIEFDYGASLRMAPDTQVRFTRLDPNNHVAQIAEGTLEIRVFRGLAAHPEIDTPGAAIRPDDAGRVRITVGSDGNTEVTVRGGQADIETASGTRTISGNTTVFVTGLGDAATVAPVATIPLDGFDRFNDDRDTYLGQTPANAPGNAYDDEGLMGAGELAEYGQWVSSQPYGQVWEPTDQSNGWAPYHSGRFVWEPYYGWTWIADEPWGWAPYHYGNWFYNNDDRWAWYPGTYAAAQPFTYSPARVAFFGYGSGDGFGSDAFGSPFGNIGWVPVAPGEPFSPWWGYGGNGWGYGNNSGGTTYVTNTTVVNNIVTVYKNANVLGGAVGVNNGAFSAGSFTHLTPIRPVDIGGTHLFRGGIVPIVPTSSNLAFSGNAPRPIASPKRPIAFTRFKPLATTPHSFLSQRAAVAGVATRFYPERAAIFAKSMPQQTAPHVLATPHALTTPTSSLGPAGRIPRGDPFVRFGSPTPGAGPSGRASGTAGPAAGSPEAGSTGAGSTPSADASGRPFHRFVKVKPAKPTPSPTPTSGGQGH